MQCALGISAVLISGLTLALLVMLAMASARIEIDINEPVPELDPLVAQAEIEVLREAKGSVLEGSTLAHFEPDDGFASTLAQYTGARALAAAPMDDCNVAEFARIPTCEPRNSYEFRYSNTRQSSCEDPNNSKSLVESLRRSARQYEEFADDLEEQSRYDEADKLRTLAAETRRLARDLTPVTESAQQRAGDVGHPVIR